MASPLRLGLSLSSSLRTLLRRFSSLPSPASGGYRAFASSPPAEESVAYRQSMIRRPGTVRRWDVRRNRCSFIGRVVLPVKTFDNTDNGFGAYTLLEMKPDRSPPFRILLAMRDELAKISLQHIKPEDFVYVSGFLGSYTKVNEGGKNEIYYKVSVTDLNYVRHGDHNHSSQEQVCSRAEGVRVPTSGVLSQHIAPSSCAAHHEEERRKRLHLWQVFFASPYEWWDNRQGKKNPRYPDFRHKDTRECLWLKPDDPPWLRKQLQLYDSKMAAGHQRCTSSRGHEWKLKDMEYFHF